MFVKTSGQKKMETLPSETLLIACKITSCHNPYNNPKLCCRESVKYLNVYIHLSFFLVYNEMPFNTKYDNSPRKN